MKRKKTDVWSELGQLAIAGITGYVTYKLLEESETHAQESPKLLERTDNYDYKKLRKVISSLPGLFVLNSDVNLLDRIEKTINFNTDARVKIKIEKNTGYVRLIEQNIVLPQMHKREAGNKILKDLFSAIKNKSKQVTLTYTKEENGVVIRRNNDSASNGQGSSSDIKYSFNKYSNAYYKNMETGKLFTQLIPVHIGLMHEFKHATLAARGTSFYTRNLAELPFKGFCTFFSERDREGVPLTVDLEEALIIGKPMRLYGVRTGTDGYVSFTEVISPTGFGPTENELYAEQGLKFRRMSHEAAI